MRTNPSSKNRNKNMRKRILLNTIKPLLLLVMLQIVFSCGTSNSQQEVDALAESQDFVTLQKNQFEAAQMQLIAPIDTLFQARVAATGIVDVPRQNRMKIGSFFGGKVFEIFVHNGSKVNKGDRLLSIENPEYLAIQQSYIEASARAANLEQNYKRQEELAAQNISSAKELQNAKAEYLSAMALRAALKEKIMLLQLNPEEVMEGRLTAKIVLKAPFAGSVTALQINRGQWLTDEMTALELINSSQLLLYVEVFEKNFTQLQAGQPVYFRFLDNNPQEHQAVIRSFSPEVDPAKRSVEVLAEISPVPEGLRAGMFVNVEIAINEFQVTALPEDAISENDGRFFALRLDQENAEGYRFKKTEVLPGQALFGLRAVRFVESLPSNSRFLSKGVFQLVQPEE